MSKAIGRIYGVGSRSPYGYETDYMKYLQGYNPYVYEQTLRNMSQSYTDISVNSEYNYNPPATQMQSGEQQLKMPAGSEYYITTPKPQEPSNWDKIKDWTENTGDAMQAGAVGYATGATLGNFDEGIGAATSAVTGNPDNYNIGRDATRQLQNELQQRHPYIYGGAEILGATIAGKYFSPYVAPVITGIGYANNVNDIPINIGKNAVVSKFTREIQKIPLLPQNIRDLGQNTASWYLLDKESQGK